MNDKLLTVNYNFRFLNFHPETKKEHTEILTNIQEQTLEKIKIYESTFSYHNHNMDVKMVVELKNNPNNTLKEIDCSLERILIDSKIDYDKILTNAEIVLKKNYEVELYKKTIYSIFRGKNDNL